MSDRSAPPRPPLDILADEIRDLPDAAKRDLRSNEYEQGHHAAFLEGLGLITDRREEGRGIEDEHVPGRIYGRIVEIDAANYRMYSEHFPRGRTECWS